jgi:hypothetical protein
LTNPGSFTLNLEGVYAPNALVIYASTNHLDWEPIFTNPPVIGPAQFLDQAASNFPTRFYRAGEE